MSTPERGEQLKADICIVGGGIAGLSLAAELAPHANVIVLEAEEQPGRHATGRSVANYSETHSTPAVRALTRASRDTLMHPPPDFADRSILTERAVLYFGRDDQRAALDALARDASAAGTTIKALTSVETLALAPSLRADYVAAGVLEPEAYDIDVDLLLQARVRAFKRADGRLICGSRLEGATRDGTTWRIEAGGRQIAANVLVNAAGAWADDVAMRAGVAPIGFVPKLRSVALLPVDDRDIGALPFCVDADGAFYLKPDSGRLLLSPMDERPHPPADAFADDYALAEAMERLTQATSFPARRPSHSWGGLRTFAPDRTFVIGFDGRAPGFFWLAGQGGAGIQTSPAASSLAAFLVLGDGAASRVPAVDPQIVSPQRFQR
jgi:D-arginine dehydrogenase